MPTLTEADVAEIRARHDHDENYYAGKSSSEYPRHRMHLDRANLLANIDSLTAQIARKDEAFKDNADTLHRLHINLKFMHGTDLGEADDTQIHLDEEISLVEKALRRASSAMEDR